MNKLIYSLSVSFHSACSNKKILLTILLSYYFGLLLPFYCLANIEVFASLLGTIELIDPQNTCVAELPAVESGKYRELEETMASPDLKHFLAAVSFRGDLQVGETSMKVSVLGTEEDLLSFERFEIVEGTFSLDTADEIAGAPDPLSDGEEIHIPECVAARGLANKYGLHIGDVLTVNGADYRIVGIVNSLRHAKTIFIPVSAVPRTGESMRCRLYLNYSSPPDITQVKQRLDLQIRQARPDYEESSVRLASDMARQFRSEGIARSAVILLVGGISVLLTILNTFLVVSAKYEEDKKKLAVKLALGAAKRNIGMEIFFENVLFVCAANCLLWASSPVLTTHVPVRAEFVFSGRVYLVLLGVSVSAAGIMSGFLRKKVFGSVPAVLLRG